MTERGRRRNKQLLNDFREKRGCWKLKEEALDNTVWRTRFGRGCGPLLNRLQNERNFALDPVQSSSVQFNPVQSSSVQFNPVQSSSIQFNPV